MDDLDARLIEAWGRVRERLLREPAAAGRRWERGLRNELRRPMRAWCLCLKAADTRIDPAALFEHELIDERKRHRVLMFGEEVRALCEPVQINWPGETYDVAARRLGIDVRTMIDWMDKGWVASRRERVPGRRGKLTRYVWTRGAMDVTCPQGHDAKWGTLWQGLYERVPEAFEQVLERVPRVRCDRRDRSVWERGQPGEVGCPGGNVGSFRGWDWVCPGRVLADGTAGGCGRVCKKLYLPLPVWTIDRAKGVEAMVAQPWGLRRSFACAKCWNPQWDAGGLMTTAGWNRFVSAISGGLLYGREVPKDRAG